MASHGIKDRVAIVGMGCTRFAEHWDKGLDDLIIEASEDTFASAGVTKDDVDAYWFGHRPVGDERHHPGPAPAAGGQAGDPGRELLHHRVRGAPGRGLRGGVGGLRRGHGGGRGEGQGLRVPGPQRLPHPQRRHRPHPHRGGHVLHGGPGLRQEVRRGRGRADRGAGPHLVEEPPQRRRQPPGPVPQGGLHRDHLRLTPGGRPPRGVRLRRRGRRGRRGHRGPGRGRPPLHGQAPLHQGAVVLGRQRLGSHRPRLRLHLVPRVRPDRRGRLRPGRHHRPPPPAGHGRGARLLHAHRAGADGGPRVRRAGHGVEGGAGRHVRP